MVLRSRVTVNQLHYRAVRNFITGNDSNIPKPFTPLFSNQWLLIFPYFFLITFLAPQITKALLWHGKMIHPPWAYEKANSRKKLVRNLIWFMRCQQVLPCYCHSFPIHLKKSKKKKLRDCKFSMKSSMKMQKNAQETPVEELVDPTLTTGWQYSKYVAVFPQGFMS